MNTKRVGGGETDRQTDRERQRERETGTERQRQRDRDRESDRKTETERKLGGIEHGKLCYQSIWLQVAKGVI